MKKHLSTILLTLVLLACLAILVFMIFSLSATRECKHHFCDRTDFLPTCNEKGYTRYVCKQCAYEFDADFLAPLGHDYTESVIEPTCEEEGYTLHTCSICQKEKKDAYTAPKGHKLTQTVTDPTCETEGYTLHECENCDYSFQNTYTAPLEHVFVTNVIKPTCDSTGCTQHKCENCGYEFVNDITVPTGHTYTKEYFRPNIDFTGYTKYTCTECQKEHVSDFVFYSDIFSGAAGEGNGALARGVDLSKWSYDVDFEALRDAGIDFVILRIGFNETKDPRFEAYYTGAKAAGLDVGVYYFTLSTDAVSATEDADRIAEWLNGKQLEYPVFYDVEDYLDYKPSTFSEEQIMDITHTFMTSMVDRGYYPGLYTNNKFLYELYNNEKTLRLYDVWYARYNEVTDERILEYSALYSMWQYEGDVEGYLGGAVEGACDLNYCFKNYPEIMKKYGFNGY